jgi:hypothetical protein
MRLTLDALFPRLPRFCEVNLDEWLRAHCPVRPEGAEAYERELERMQAQLGAPAYGGWMEDREWMWSGSYMTATRKYTHLGLDVYLRQGTEVRLPFAVTVLDAFFDEDCEVGWGGRLTVQRAPGAHAIVLGHLERELPQRGAALPASVPFARLATWPMNGDVFEHLHIQLIRPGLLAGLDWSLLDGYGFAHQAVDFPHPLLTEV